MTTGWELTETVDGKESKRQEIFDVLIADGKIKPSTLPRDQSTNRSEFDSLISVTAR